MHSLLDGTSIAILLPTSTLLILSVAALKRRLHRLAIQSLEPVAITSPLLQIYDPPLSVSEVDFVSGNHTMELHGKGLCLAWLFSAVVNATATVWLSFLPNEPIAIIWFVSGLMAVSIFLIVFVKTTKPCDCGAIRLLSPKTRLDQLWTIRSYATFSLKRELKSLAILIPLCVLILGAFIGFCLIVADVYALIFPGARVATAAAITVPNIILFVLSVAISFVDTTKRFITRAELERITSLRGETPEELNELIAFYARVGNFKKTDEYSKKLLEFREASRL